MAKRIDPPKQILKIAGWKIFADKTQFTIKKENIEHYFTDLSACLYDIVKSEGDKKLKDKGLMEIKDAIKILTENKETIITEINNALKK